MPGLMTVQGLLKKIYTGLPKSEDFKQYHSIQITKQQCELLIRQQKYDDPSVIELKRRLVNGEEIVLIAQVSNYLPLFARIENLLERGIAQGKFDQEQEPFVRGLIEIYGKLITLFKPGFFGNRLLKVAEREKKALEGDRWKKYLDAYDEEKALLFSFKALFEKGGMSTYVKDFSMRPAWVRRYKIVEIAAMLTVIMSVFVYAQLDRWVDPLYETVKVYEQLDSRVETKAELELEQKYGFNIIGEFNNADLELLKQKLPSPEIVQSTGLKRIVFLGPGDVMKTRGMAGMAQHGGSEIRVFSSTVKYSPEIGFVEGSEFDHEFAHQYHFWVERNNPEFNATWNKVAGPYNRVQQTGRGYEYTTPAPFPKIYRSPYFGLAVRDGYTRAYGGITIHEDVAEFVSTIKSRPDNLAMAQNAFNTYRQKIRMLHEAGFITTTERDTALGNINKAEQQAAPGGAFEAFK